MNKKIQVTKYSPTFWGNTFSRQSNHLKYLKVYLEALKLKTVVCEPNYFESNYTAEFSAFYSRSAKDIHHNCIRHLFFSEAFNRNDIRKLAANDELTIQRMKNSFLGFVVQRPIEHAELGKTVLKWFEDYNANEPRIIKPSRPYKVNFINVELNVEGVAWQQQDRGISACATVALWSILQSSANREEIFIPTTRDLTENANLKSYGTRVFPSPGLTVNQICEAIKQNMMSPILMEGDISLASLNDYGFSKEVFCNYIGTLIKSGYPILLSGRTVKRDGGMKIYGEGHALCCVGYRSVANPSVPAGTIGFDEANIRNIYIHDDNYGPNLRFEINTIRESKNDVVILKATAPNLLDYNYKMEEDPLKDSYEFIPSEIVIAINRDIFVGPQDLISNGMLIGKELSTSFKNACERENLLPMGLNLSFRYINAVEYIRDEIDILYKGSDSKISSRIRLELKEKTSLSKHLGIIRYGLGRLPMLDLLIDTSNIDDQTQIIAAIAFNGSFESLLELFQNSIGSHFPIVKGY